MFLARHILFWDILALDASSFRLRRREKLTSAHDTQYRAMLRRLRSARLEAGKTQGDIAKALRKPQSYVSKCESGERRIDPIELMRFAAIYGVSVAKLLDLSDF